VTNFSVAVNNKSDPLYMYSRSVGAVLNLTKFVNELITVCCLDAGNGLHEQVEDRANRQGSWRGDDWWNIGRWGKLRLPTFIISTVHLVVKF